MTQRLNTLTHAVLPALQLLVEDKKGFRGEVVLAAGRGGVGWGDPGSRNSWLHFWFLPAAHQ